MSAGIILFAAFAVCLIVGVPVSISLGVASLCSVVFGGLSASSTVIAQRIFGGLQSTSIMAIAFFVLAGNLMTKGGISRRIVNFANCLVGNVRGGMSLALVLACAFFAALSGSAPATVIAIGTMLYNDMVKLGYPGDRTAGLLVVSGGLGPIIPPSIIMVIYCTLTGASVGNMFKQGMLIGIVIMLVLMTEVLFYAKKENWPKQAVKRSPSEIFKIFLDAIPALMTPIIILGGIYAGIFTPTEAAVVAIFYTILVGIFIHKELTLKSFMASLKTTSWLTGRVLVLVFTATAFGYLLTSYRIPVEIANWILSFTNNVNLVWFFVVILLLFLGMFMETLAIIMLVTPVLLPIMTAYGVDPIHFGIILICCCGIGFSTPPLGENMFIASGIANISLEEISLKALPLVAINIAVIAILVMFPDIVLFLPNLMGTGLQ